jgi:hypothetical protein
VARGCSARPFPERKAALKLSRTAKLIDAGLALQEAHAAFVRDSSGHLQIRECSCVIASAWRQFDLVIEKLPYLKYFEN